MFCAFCVSCVCVVYVCMCAYSHTQQCCCRPVPHVVLSSSLQFLLYLKKCSERLVARSQEIDGQFAALGQETEVH